MEDTGERHIVALNFTDAAAYYIHLLHIASYEYALKFVAGKRVLDYGCGSGYGAKILSQDAEIVVATDISREAVDFARENYKSDNLYFKEYYELGSEKFDIIISFQVIEHVSNDIDYIKSLKAKLVTGGFLLITTPDKKNRLFCIQKPWNIYHLKEYSEKNIGNLLSKYFNHISILKISANSDLALPEIIRRKRQRLVTLPFSLAFYPKSLRVYLLKFEAKVYNFIVSFRKKHGDSNNSIEQKKSLSFQKFTSKDIIISVDVENPTDFFIICK